MELIILICLGVVGVGIVGIVLYVINFYNKYNTQSVLVDEAWSGIDVQLKKRFDLIPNLVETVKAYAKHEGETFEKVAELRSGMMQATENQDVEAVAKMEGELRSTLKTLFAVAESYPELKANENFASLQGSLQEIEDELEGARRYYNGAARDINQIIVTFPNNIFAGFFSFKKRDFFEIVDAAERENVKVDFS